MMEVARGVHRMEGIRGANAYLYLTDDGRVVVSDTGMAGNADRIVSQVEALGRKRGEIEMIVLTHPDASTIREAQRSSRGSQGRGWPYTRPMPLASLGKDSTRKQRGSRGFSLG